ncbi:MAG: hypothetical protein KAI50_10335 [Desulfobacterales bacterium]|nr:hypothetical protein [Desulfobacterales bacterium]
MIGVIAKESEKEVAMEFFQLFKTPWEFFQKNQRYDIVIVATDKLPSIDTKLTVFYNSNPTRFDFKEALESEVSNKSNPFEYQNLSFPIYGQALTFCKQEQAQFTLEQSKESVVIEVEREDKKIIRIGYDLFGEINFLLSKGQPVAFAQIPAIERHIAILRKLILNAGLYLIEIPPAPKGYDFTVCLTHDVDFAGIRRHLFDHTVFGFIYRAIIGSIVGILKQRIPIKNLIRNWYSVLLLPGVFFGLVKDFWIQFKRYIELEEPLPSTFYFIPSKNYEGLAEKGKAPRIRAVRYDVHHIHDQIKLLIDHGCEIGLHGIDAWIDHKHGRKEFAVIAKIAGSSDIGIRMHWLYFNKKSPWHLAKAGFLYDSTLGYNEAIGFRSGTVQAFCMLGAGGIIELPMNVMDTALFYPDRMNLTEAQAWCEVQKIITSVAHFGGVLTINWHHRSLAPERLWDSFYVRLLKNLKQRKVWFATATQAVHWFQKRREIEFCKPVVTNNSISIELRHLNGAPSPGMAMRVYKPRNTNQRDESGAYEYVDLEIPDKNGDITLEINNPDNPVNPVKN